MQCQHDGQEENEIETLEPCVRDSSQELQGCKNGEESKCNDAETWTPVENCTNEKASPGPESTEDVSVINGTIKTGGDATDTDPDGDDTTEHEPTGENDGSQNPTTDTLSEKALVDPQDTIEGCGYPEIPDPHDPARILGRSDLLKQRIFFWSAVASVNIGMIMVAFLANMGVLVLVFMILVKTRDFLSVMISAVGMSTQYIYRLFKPLKPVPRQWILTLIPAYSESEEQIVKTIYSLRDNDVGQHRQVMVVCLDGKPRDVRSHMTRIVREFERPYITARHRRGALKITAGFAQDVPVIVIEKVKNSGKCNSLGPGIAGVSFTERETQARKTLSCSATICSTWRAKTSRSTRGC